MLEGQREILELIEGTVSRQQSPNETYKRRAYFTSYPTTVAKDGNFSDGGSLEEVTTRTYRWIELKKGYTHSCELEIAGIKYKPTKTVTKKLNGKTYKVYFWNGSKDLYDLPLRSIDDRPDYIWQDDKEEVKAAEGDPTNNIYEVGLSGHGDFGIVSKLRDSDSLGIEKLVYNGTSPYMEAIDPRLQVRDLSVDMLTPTVANFIRRRDIDKLSIARVDMSVVTHEPMQVRELTCDRKDLLLLSHSIDLSKVEHYTDTGTFKISAKGPIDTVLKSMTSLVSLDVSIANYLHLLNHKTKRRITTLKIRTPQEELDLRDFKSLTTLKLFSINNMKLNYKLPETLSELHLSCIPGKCYSLTPREKIHSEAGKQYLEELKAFKSDVRLVVDEYPITLEIPTPREGVTIFSKQPLGLSPPHKGFISEESPYMPKLISNYTKKAVKFTR